MPIQGWKLHPANENAQVKVLIGPFQGDALEFNAEGPFDIDTASHWLSKDNIRDLNIGSSATREEHIAKIEKAIDQIRLRDLRKVVISRKEVVDADISITDTFLKLNATYSNAIVYALFVDGQMWMGATPETLLTTDEHALYTMALAGTRKPDGPAFTEKEFDEQEAVTDSIREVLMMNGASKIVCKGPRPVKAGPVEHLLTQIEASLPASRQPSDWAKLLHPTPAVCGQPKDDALSIISELENYDRSLYAGYIGWVSSENSRFYVNLRCMQVGQKHVALYAGGGITAQSNAESEWEETVNKLQTLKAVILPDNPTS